MNSPNLHTRESYAQKYFGLSYQLGFPETSEVLSFP